jgi:hypothetical protein
MTEDLDFSLLVEMRRRHQTRQATLGVRTRASNTENLELSLKQHPIHHMHDMLKQQNDQAVGTGAEHSVRWGTSSTPGNSANVPAVAVVVAKQVSIFFALLPTLPILCQHSTKFQYAMVLSRKHGKKAEMERKVDEDLLDVFEV